MIDIVHVGVVDVGSGVSVRIQEESVGIHDAFVEDDFVSFGFFDRF